MATVLIVPGLHGSGPDHWQTWLETKLPDSVRVVQRDWSKPNISEWSARIRREIDRAPGEIRIVAHSFGCLATAEVARTQRHRIKDALLVAPASPLKFGRVPPSLDQELGFPSLLVASRSDPWMGFAEAAFWAESWGSQLVDLGEAGHINVESGYGPWPGVLDLLDRLGRRPVSAGARKKWPDIFDQLGEIV